jgi:hypothetical protein
VNKLLVMTMVVALSMAQLMPVQLLAAEPASVVKPPANKDKDPEQYYRDIGRDDIASKYAERSNSQTTGVAFIVIGSLFLGLSSLMWFGENFDNETPDNTGSLVVMGLGLVALGGGIYLVSLPDDPFSPEELKALEQQPASWSTPFFGVQFQF